MNAIELLNLSKTYSEQKALDQINLTISVGSIFGYIGPNGAGKSTTVNCITGLITPDSGVVSVLGKVITNNSILTKQRMGVLFENMEDLFIYLKGEEQLRFTGEIFGMSKDIIKQRMSELIEYFGLEDHKHKIIAEYSKGMRKKLALASILLHNPDVLILDEPFEGLDAFTVIRLKNLLRSLRDKGKTVFITSHILAYIEDTCDEVAIINRGKIVFQAPTGNIRSIVKNEFSNETYKSLEEVFIDLTIPSDLTTTLSWI